MQTVRYSLGYRTALRPTEGDDMTNISQEEFRRLYDAERARERADEARERQLQALQERLDRMEAAGTGVPSSPAAVGDPAPAGVPEPEPVATPDTPPAPTHPLFRKVRGG